MSKDAGLGFGWTSNLQARLEISASSILVREGTGRGERFTKNAAGVWTGDADTTLAVTQDASGYTVTRNNGATLRYDSYGRLLSAADRSGKTTTYMYDSSGRLAAVTGPFGHTLSLGYDATGHLASLTDPTGAVYAYGYDANNNLVQVTFPDHTAKVYHYEDARFPHHLTGISYVDTAGFATRYSTYAYDAKGKAIRTEHAATTNGGPQESFALAYDSQTQTTVTDPVGTKTIYTFVQNLGAKKLLSKTNLTDGKTLSQTFDVNNNLTCRKDPEGRVTLYAYNAANQRVSRTQGLVGDCAHPLTTPETRTTSYQYLSADLDLPTLIERPSVYAGAKKQTVIAYDTSRNPLSFTRRGYTPEGAAVARTVAFHYNHSGQVIEIDGARTDLADVTTLSYYDCATGGACGRVRAVTNALRQTTTFEAYDANGRLLALTDPNGLKTAYAYDVRGRLVRLTQTPPGGTPRVTHYTYDGAGQLAQSVGPDGLTLTYTYDAARYLRAITDNAGNAVSYRYDLKGNLIDTAVTNPDSTAARALTWAYDSRNQVNEINAGGSLTRQVRDALGNLLAETDPNANPPTTHAYDALSRLVETIDSLGGATRYSYDAQGRASEVRAPNGAATRYAHDDLGNLLSEASPDRGTTHYDYDEAGNVITRTDARGVTAYFSYDPLNRPLTVTYSEGNAGGGQLLGWLHGLMERGRHAVGWGEDSGAISSTVTYTYDACPAGLGRLCAVEDQSGLKRFAYDAFGNRVEETHETLGHAYTTRYSYDAANRISAITYPSGRQVAYSRDPIGRINTIATTVNGALVPVVSHISYRADGLPLSLTFGNGVADQRAYDTRGRLLSQYIAGDYRLYGYDQNGNLTDLSTGRERSRYGYDALDRLRDETFGAEAIGFGYDPNGNRLSRTGQTITVPYMYAPESNRLIEVGQEAITLDATGNTIQSGRRGFSYHPSGRLASVSEDGRLKAAYLYDARGLRSQKLTAKGMRLYHYDLTGNLLSETTDRGTLIRDYVYLGALPVAQIDNHGRHEAKGLTKDHNKKPGMADAQEGHEDPRYPGRHEAIVYLHSDHLNTPRLATDPEQRIRWRWEGEAFGESKPQSGKALAETDGEDGDEDDGKAKTIVNLRFAGQYYDSETGLHYNWNRYYDPKIGRYLSSDPIGLAGGLNTYAYVFNSPVNLVDPSGLVAPVVAVGIGALVGGTAQAVTTAIQGGSPGEVGNAFVGGALAGATITAGALTGGVGGLVWGTGIGLGLDAATAGDVLAGGGGGKQCR